MECLKFASLTLSSPSPRSGMLGKQLNSSFLTIDSAAQLSYCRNDLAAASSITLPNIRFSCRTHEM
ncbi:hypothetical protein Fmac_023782 [Flemingia macrophylla]|uniref:Uncharacterized protein n=1 Tax=Flemingia macrophylla TaxID=520843 RepID=A0ABD1LMH6_9FABA